MDILKPEEWGKSIANTPVKKELYFHKAVNNAMNLEKYL